jgi:hypothetical protein
MAVAWFVSGAAFAQENVRLPESQPQPVAQNKDSSLPSSVHPSLVGVDLNNDGIRDDIKNFVERETSAPAPPPAAHASVVTKELSSTIHEGKKRAAQPARRSCFDYLLLEPKDRALADRHLQTSRQAGTFGTHPCDPFVAPSLDRFFDTDFAELRLGPAHLPTH